MQVLYALILSIGIALILTPIYYFIFTSLIKKVKPENKQKVLNNFIFTMGIITITIIMLIKLI